jgi:hypothetical protein
LLDVNKKKCPDWFDPEKYLRKGKKSDQNGHHNSEVDAVGRSGRGSGMELLLLSMSFPNSLKLLEDPNIWIADTGATCNTTPHKVGARNIKQPTKEDTVTFGDGKNNTAKQFLMCLVF